MTVVAESMTPNPEPARTRLRCAEQCPEHPHDCGRDWGHLGPHRDRQQKGTETCSWEAAEPGTPCENTECEAFREWLSGEKADADKRVRRAELERNDARAAVERLTAELAKAREQAAADLDAHSKDLMDAAVKQVLKSDDDGFSGVRHAATVAYAAKYLRGEAATS